MGSGDRSQPTVNLFVPGKGHVLLQHAQVGRDSRDFNLAPFIHQRVSHQRRKQLPQVLNSEPSSPGFGFCQHSLYQGAFSRRTQPSGSQNHPKYSTQTEFLGFRYIEYCGILTINFSANILRNLCSFSRAATFKSACKP